MQVAHLGELTSRTVRDKFARLSQLALLLGLESPDEVGAPRSTGFQGFRVRILGF